MEGKALQFLQCEMLGMEWVLSRASKCQMISQCLLQKEGKESIMLSALYYLHRYISSFLQTPLNTLEIKTKFMNYVI